jgi:hypothetical protein
MMPSLDQQAASMRFTEARAVGDLDGLQARLDALSPLMRGPGAARRAERARQQEETEPQRSALCSRRSGWLPAHDWRGGVNRFRALLEEWKALPRSIGRPTTPVASILQRPHHLHRAPQSQFAQQNEQREAARVIKEKLVTEARRLLDSTIGARQRVPTAI